MQEKTLTSKQAADYIGISDSTLRRWRCSQKHPEIPFVKIGGKILYNLVVLDSFLQMCKEKYILMHQ